ncbi:MAG: acetyltransferase [Pseudomonadota bacterium]
MYLMYKPSSDLIEVLNLDSLFNPFQKDVNGRFLAGDELQAPAAFVKDDLVFPSGETLPRCWVNPAYQDKLRAVGG